MKNLVNQFFKALLDEAMKAQSSSSLDMSLLSFHLLKLKVSPFVHFQVPSYNQTTVITVINDELLAVTGLDPYTSGMRDASIIN